MKAKPQKPLILIIDDEEALRDGCRQALEKSGYAVLTAGEGVEGIKIAREQIPDMAFVDLKMPNISGMEIIDILSRDIPDIVLIMITGYASIVSAVEAIQKGAYDYLPKPFSPDQLRALTRRGLDHRNLRIETRRLREEKERMEKSFITFVSHEMRSPLVVIRQYIETLKAIAGDRFDKDVTDIIERCSKRIQGLEEMIEHWLDLSRIEDGTLAQKKDPLNLASIIARSTEEMTPVCQGKGISLETNIPENLPEITGDEESLVRVFTNIIGNATKYTPDGGKITVSAQHDEHYVTASISDTGTGIPQDKLPFIFEPFFRVRGKEEKHRGSGLGLTFCKKIVEAHNGGIDVLSREGEGTTFLLKFPAQIHAAKRATGAIS
ncbi:MAG: hybrid sensor histidine kinase/response regulator [Deltaproteobacteria bacterium]|nr:hybrid sensor histidine kinase/response regulator [Deltaproteobacteria bacterium]